MLAFLNTPTFPVFSPPTYFSPAFILRFYLSFIFYLLCFFLLIYHVMRTDTCNKPHTLRDAVTGRNRNTHTPTHTTIYILSLPSLQALLWIPPLPTERQVNLVTAPRSRGMRERQRRGSGDGRSWFPWPAHRTRAAGTGRRCARDTGL